MSDLDKAAERRLTVALPFNFGDFVRDRYTGIKGTVTHYAVYCDNTLGVSVSRKDANGVIAIAELSPNRLEKIPREEFTE